MYQPILTIIKRTRKELREQQFTSREEAIANLLISGTSWGMDVYAVEESQDHIMDRTTSVQLIAWGESATEWVETWAIKPTELYHTNKPRKYTLELIDPNGKRAPRIVGMVGATPIIR